jgi:hypothetical protein
MNTALERITARRAWFVQEFVVWGVQGTGRVDYLALEAVDSTVSVLYGNADPGGGVQEVSFAELVDHRGNNLPATLKSPKVIPRPRGASTAYVVAAESSERFLIARDPDAAGPVLTDLLILEMGD